MVGLRGTLSLVVIGAVIAAVVYFRNQLGQTGQALGAGLSGLGQGFADIGGGTGAGLAGALGGLGAGLGSVFSIIPGLGNQYRQSQYQPVYFQKPQLGGDQCADCFGNQVPNVPHNDQSNTVINHTNRETSDTQTLTASQRLLVSSGLNFNQAFDAAVSAQVASGVPHAQASANQKAISGGLTPFAVFQQTRQATDFHTALSTLPHLAGNNVVTGGQHTNYSTPAAKASLASHFGPGGELR